MHSKQTNQAAYALLVMSASTAVATLVPVALYQLGALTHLPDPPGGIFDSDRITSSKDAHPFGVPDALLGLGSFGATLSLSLLAPRSGLARRLLGWKLAADGGAAGINAVKQVVKFRALCSWCTGTALAATAAGWAGRRYLRSMRD